MDWRKEREEKKMRKKHHMRWWRRTFFTLIAITILIIVVAFIANLEPRREYAEAVGGHIENAKISTTPDLMKQELETAINGTSELGLEDNDHGACLKWYKTPEVSVKYHRERFVNITIRLDEIIEWREDDNYTQEMQDVYNKKFENVRELLNDDNDWESVDGVIKDAWYVKEHFFLYISGVIFLVFVAVTLFCGMLYMPLDSRYSKRQ